MALKSWQDHFDFLPKSTKNWTVESFPGLPAVITEAGTGRNLLLAGLLIGTTT